MDYPVKYFHSAMRGAPTLSGTAGSLLALFDACLTTGFGLVTAQSVTVAGGIATATLPLGQSFEEHAIVQIDGATPDELNGNARVLPGATSSQIQWATDAADGPATGSITLKTAPADWWTKVYAGVNKAVWRSGDMQSNGHYLRIDDSGTTVARVTGYESMTDVDTGAGPFPTAAQISGGGYWPKSLNANANAVQWMLFADSRFFILSVAPGFSSNASYKAAPARGFGDAAPLRPAGDAWATVLSAKGDQNVNSNLSIGAFDSAQASSATNGAVFAPRALAGLGSAVLLDNRPATGSAGALSGNDNYLGAFPSEVDGALRLARVYAREQAADKPPRALVPGIYYAPQSGLINYMTSGDAQPGAGDLAGRRLVAVATSASSSSNTPTGVYFVDVTGPWR